MVSVAKRVPRRRRQVAVLSYLGEGNRARRIPVQRDEATIDMPRQGTRPPLGGLVSCKRWNRHRIWPDTHHTGFVQNVRGWRILSGNTSTM